VGEVERGCGDAWLLENWGGACSDPAEGMKVPQEARREMLFLSAAQVRDVAESVKPPFDTLVYLLALVLWSAG